MIYLEMLLDTWTMCKSCTCPSSAVTILIVNDVVVIQFASSSSISSVFISPFHLIQRRLFFPLYRISASLCENATLAQKRWRSIEDIPLWIGRYQRGVLYMANEWINTLVILWNHINHNYNELRKDMLIESHRSC